MIRIEVLPAAFGDCLFIEYGSAASPHRILIDAGLAATFQTALAPRLARLPAPVALELLVVTHIDRDHICGILPLLRAAPRLVEPADVWFNGRDHLTGDELGAKEGEALGKLLMKAHLPWNAAFGPHARHAVVVPDRGALPTTTLPGGAVITLLSPYAGALAALAREWDDQLGAWDAEPEPTPAPAVPQIGDDLLGKRPPLESIDVDTVRELADAELTEDTAKPNGSSIAFLFEYHGKRILFGADANPSQLLRSLDRLSDEPIELDAFKLSHHGSMNNISRDLLAKIRCPRFLVSSNGDSFGHPHPETLACIVTASPKKKTLCFNYETPYTTVWNEPSTMKKFAYDVAYPEDPAAGYVLSL